MKIQKYIKILNIIILLLTFIISISLNNIYATVNSNDSLRKVMDDIYKTEYLDFTEQFCKSGVTNKTWWPLYKTRPIILKTNTTLWIEKDFEKIDFEKYKTKEFSLSEELLEKRKEFLKQMDNIYLCAKLNSENKVRKTILTKTKPFRSNKTELLSTKISEIEKKMKDNNCKSLSLDREWNDAFTSISRTLLDNMSFKECQYVAYINYIKKLKSNNPTSLFRTKDSKGNILQQISSDDLVDNINKFNATDLGTEEYKANLATTRAYDSILQYERTFPIHVMLEFIEDDYKQISLILPKLLNPISQFFFKILNAQLPY